MACNCKIKGMLDLKGFLKLDGLHLSLDYTQLQYSIHSPLGI